MPAGLFLILLLGAYITLSLKCSRAFSFLRCAVQLIKIYWEFWTQCVVLWLFVFLVHRSEPWPTCCTPSTGSKRCESDRRGRHHSGDINGFGDSRLWLNNNQSLDQAVHQELVRYLHWLVLCSDGMMIQFPTLHWTLQVDRNVLQIGCLSFYFRLWNSPLSSSIVVIKLTKFMWNASHGITNVTDC